MAYIKCPVCGLWSHDKRHRKLVCSNCAQTLAAKRRQMNIDPRLIHDAVLPEVVGDYEAAEA